MSELISAIRATLSVNAREAWFFLCTLRDRLKGAGAAWDPEQKPWRVRWGIIQEGRELVERVVRG